MPLTACGPAYASLSQLQSTRRLARRPSRPLALRNPVQSNAKTHTRRYGMHVSCYRWPDISLSCFVFLSKISLLTRPQVCKYV
jgi:hypothetical protein